MRSPRAGPGRAVRARGRGRVGELGGTPAPSSRVTARPQGHLGMLAVRPRPPRPLPTAVLSPRPPAPGGWIGAVGASGAPPSPTGHPTAPNGTRTVRRYLTGHQSIQYGVGAHAQGGMPAAGAVRRAPCSYSGSASDGVSSRLLPGRRPVGSCAFGGSDGGTDGSRRPGGAGISQEQRSQTSRELPKACVVRWRCWPCGSCHSSMDRPGRA